MRRVVITGMGVVSPIGSTVARFYAGLRAARPGVDTIRSFDAATFPTRIAGEVDDLDLTEIVLPEPERPALLRDPKSVFGIVAAREALAESFGADGLPASYPRDRRGIAIAAGLEIFHLEDIVAHVADGRIDAGGLREWLGRAPPQSRLQIPAHLGAYCIGREVDAGGLFQVNVSACAAGTQAIGEGFRAVRDGVVELALCGGYDSMVNPLGVGGFSLLGAMSTSNQLRGAASRPFAADRDGFVLGEGAAMFVLEERSAALARSAPIHAELLGYASTLDGYRVSDPAPDHAGAAVAMRAALRDAGAEPADIDYINAHGTGTGKNDPAETRAIRAVFTRHADRIPVSSTKSQVGHLIGASGAVELLASIFALEKGLLPATINLTRPDPECDLDYVPISPRVANPERVLSNSFGFGGQNACLVVGHRG